MIGNNMIENKPFKEYEEEVDLMLKDKDMHAMRNLLNKAQTSYLKEERLDSNLKVRSFKNVYFYAAAATIVICLGIGGYFKFVVPSIDNKTESLYLAYYQPYVTDVNTRSSEAGNSEMTNALTAYSNKDYPKAIELLNAIKTPSELAEANFYKGLSNMEIGRFKQSIESFNLVLVSNNQSFIPHGHWYTALTWIKLNNIQAAKQHLLWLKENDRFYGKKANEILTLLQ